MATSPKSNPGHLGGRRVQSLLRHPCSPDDDDDDDEDDDDHDNGDYDDDADDDCDVAFEEDYDDFENGDDNDNDNYDCDDDDDKNVIRNDNERGSGQGKGTVLAFLLTKRHSEYF